MDFKITSGKLNEPMRLVLYGKDGVGKTELASQFPDPIFICAEQGTGHLDVNRFPEPKNFTEVEEMIKYLQDKGKYKTLVIDTLDWMEALLHKRCETELGKELSKIGYNKGYEYALEKTRDFVNLLKTVSKTMNVVCLAHSRIRTFQDPGTGSGYDRYQLALRDDTANVWRQWADAVLFLDYQVFKRDSEDRFAQGEGKRIMYTEERPSHQAKNRYSLPFSLDMPKNKGYGILISAIKAGGSDPSILVKEITDLLPVITDEKKRAASQAYVKEIAENPSLLAEFKSKLVAIKNGGVA